MVRLLILNAQKSANESYGVHRIVKWAKLNTDCAPLWLLLGA